MFRDVVVFACACLVVIDDNGRPLQGLREANFKIKEDGRPVTVTNSTEVSAAGLNGRRDARSVVLFEMRS